MGGNDYDTVRILWSSPCVIIYRFGEAAAQKGAVAYHDLENFVEAWLEQLVNLHPFHSHNCKFMPMTVLKYKLIN